MPPSVGKCVGILLSSKAGSRGTKCDPVLLHALIHRKSPTVFDEF